MHYRFETFKRLNTLDKVLIELVRAQGKFVREFENPYYVAIEPGRFLISVILIRVREL